MASIELVGLECAFDSEYVLDIDDPDEDLIVNYKRNC